MEKKVQIAHKILQLDLAVRNLGVRLECHTDFSVFRETFTGLPETNSLTGVFDDRFCNIGRENGFWVSAANEKGETIHIQAARCDDLSGTTLANHWFDEAELFAPAGYDIDLLHSDFDTAPVANSITGDVCYLGDYWLERSYRNMEVAPLLSEYGKLTALQRFSPDFLYAFMQQKMVELGWAARAGFLHMHPWAPRWHIRGKAKFYDEYFVWISGSELEKLWVASKRNIDILGRVNITDNRKPAATKYVTS